MAGVIGLEQIDFTLNFFLWNLSEHSLREMMLKLAERSHAIVDAIEKNKNGNAGKRAAA